MFTTAPPNFENMVYTETGGIGVTKGIPIHAVRAVESYEDLDKPSSSLHDSNGGLIRSASYTALVGQSKSNSLESIKRTFSETVLSSPAYQPTKISPSMQNANVELFRRASRKAKKRMSIAGIKKDLESNDRGTNAAKVASVGNEQNKSLTQSVGGSIRSLARRSWMPMTRTDSPSRKEDPGNQKRNLSPKRQASHTITPIAIPEPVASRVPSRGSPSLLEVDDNGKALRRLDRSPTHSKTRSLKDMQSRNQSAVSVNRLSRQSSRTSLGSHGSTDTMYLEIPSSTVPPLPTSDKLSAMSLELNRKKDPLWSSFRMIEGEWSNFQSKTSLQKAKVIRTVLLPFLSRYADDPSNQSLRAEDLDRRIVILNKWWTGLLDLLNARTHQSISATDRPAFLEAIMELMLRAEWRAPPFPTQSCGQGQPWTNSVESDDSDFLLETIHQNVRNTFVQNMLSQMAFVVDKMSMRSAPASLVTFSGKTCAYAFFYCPGVADVLVRLWHIPAGIIRRLFSEYGALHDSTMQKKSAEISGCFPPAVRSLHFSSQSDLVRHLQPRAQRPAGSESIRWYGPWVNRWIGRDSDLFFVFAKHYHLLIFEFHPNALTHRDRLCVPGLAAVHAQLLMVLESTLYRHVGHFTADTYPVGDSADAMIPLPMSIPNATRSMGENRLVMLLRDTINDVDLTYTNFCVLLIESFQSIMKAATRKVPMYNSDASFVLCDLVDEVIPILIQFEHLHERSGVLDWPFWMHVFQQMVQTETCMTQIRVIALLYSMWPTLTSDESRRKDLVLSWILKPTFFNQLFNHWSPMVRHYFYRLLCWRVGRNDGEATDLDIEIFKTLASRLNTAWAHHQFLVAEAEMKAVCPPSSNPCLPAPNRTLVIIRTDHSPSSPNTFTSFDKLLCRDQNSPYANHANTLNAVSDVDLPQGQVKKRWGIFRNISLFGSSPSNGRPGEVTPPGSPDRGADIRGGNSGASSAAPSRPGTPPHQPLSFKFSLDYVNNRPHMPIKHKKLQLPVLPTSAQKVVDKLSTEGKLSSESVASATIQPLKPTQRELNSARYSGRALAEWAQVVSECRNFYTRRKQEGCPKESLIETPIMAVETFRMFA